MKFKILQGLEKDEFVKKHYVQPHGWIWFTSTGREATDAEALLWEKELLTELIKKTLPGEPLIRSVGYLAPEPEEKRIGFH